jgi:transposase InsO family protein
MPQVPSHRVSNAHLVHAIAVVIEPIGDSYDNALAETIFGLFKAEVIWPNGPWKNLEEVEFATLEWIDWFNNRRLLEPLGHVPPAEFEEMYYEEQEGSAMEAGSTRRVGLPPFS